MCSGSAIIIASGIVATVVGGVGVYQGVQQKKAAEDANKTNVQMTEDTNAANVEAVKDTNQTNIQLQREMNEYNSPQNQRKMYEEAGFNPYMAADKSSFSSVQSSIPTQQAPQLQAPHVQPEALGDIASPIQQAALSVLQAYMGVAEADLNKANTVSVNLNNDFQSEMNPKLLDQQDRINHSLGLKNSAQEFTNKFNDQTFDLQVKQLRQSVVGQALNNGLLVYDNLMAQKDFANYDQRFKAEMAAYAADLVYKGAMTKKAYADVEVAMSNVTLNLAKTFGIEMDNYKAMRTAEVAIAAVCDEAAYRSAAAKFGKDLVDLDKEFWNIERVKRETELYNYYNERNRLRNNLGRNIKETLMLESLNTDGFNKFSASFLLNAFHLLEFFGQAIPAGSFNIDSSDDNNHHKGNSIIAPSSR